MFASKQLGHFIAALCALVLTVGSAWAQAATVTGTVVDKNNVPIKGVYVVVEGTTIGTSTDVAGVYRIPASSYGTLQFTCIGYKTQYVAIAGRTVINVILIDEAEMLNDDVVYNHTLINMTTIILVAIIIVLLIIAAVRKKKKSSNETVYYPPTGDNYTFQEKPSYPKTPVGPVSDSIVPVEAPISQSPITRQPVDSANQALLMGQFLQNGKYRIVRMLGQGGFGITYLAEQTMMERKVCVKEFFMKEYCNRDGATSQVSLGTQNNAAMMQKYQEKFLKEARMIARLDHPNIIRIHDVFAENNTAYYVMDYIEGKNLNEIVKERGALPEAVAVEYVRQIGEGLEYVHSHNINHLDIKPGNILIRKSDNRPILIDFGMSKQYNESGDQTSSTPVGVSAGYAPLEMYQAGGVISFSPQTDVYELGATLYYLVTGTVPPSASNILNEGLTDIPRYISPSIRTAIEQAMEPVKKNRPLSIHDFLVLLSASNASKEDDVDDATVLI